MMIPIKEVGTAPTKEDYVPPQKASIYDDSNDDIYELEEEKTEDDQPYLFMLEDDQQLPVSDKSVQKQPNEFKLPSSKEVKDFFRQRDVFADY